MKDIRPGLFAFLAADASIAAAVTEGSISRIFPVVLPQGESRASIVYTRVSGQGDYHMQGASGYSRPRYQVDAWAPAAPAAAALARAIHGALDGFKGVWGTGADAVDVQGVFCTDEREQYNEAEKMYGVSRDYFIHHGER